MQGSLDDVVGLGEIKQVKGCMAGCLHLEPCTWSIVECRHCSPNACLALERAGSALPHGCSSPSPVPLQELREAVLLPMHLPHLFTGIRRPQVNLMFHGVPGTGADGACGTVCCL